MNIYARFFNQDTLAHSLEELISFLDSIPDIPVTEDMISDIKSYVESDLPYPKRYKIRPRVYFILIKTNAENMEEFKNNNKKNKEQKEKEEYIQNTRKDTPISMLYEQNIGWYKGSLRFKRVTLIPGTNKFQYRDTDFEALVFTSCGSECYERIVNYLKSREDIDLRSQFPSAKGNNFQFEFIGPNLPEELQEQ